LIKFSVRDNLFHLGIAFLQFLAIQLAVLIEIKLLKDSSKRFFFLFANKLTSNEAETGLLEDLIGLERL
jgi:hypothetical protein